MARGGEGRVLFADNGISDFSPILYPQGLFEREDSRENAELQGAVEYLCKTLKTITGADFYLEEYGENMDA